LRCLVSKKNKTNILFEKKPFPKWFFEMQNRKLFSSRPSTHGRWIYAAHRKIIIKNFSRAGQVRAMSVYLTKKEKRVDELSAWVDK